MSEIRTNTNKTIEEIDEEFQIAVQDAPAYDPFSLKGGEAWKKWADKCREIEADLAAKGVELF